MSERFRRATTVAFAATLTIAFAVAGSAAANATTADSTLNVQILSFNDFHGNLEPPQGSSGSILTLDANGNQVSVPAGGVGYLATHLRNARKGHPNSITVTAGDNVGASPLLSAAFHDEPTINALNMLGVDLASVGNHEFDEGKEELKRMQNGGCRTDDGCYDPDNPFKGAEFDYLAANVVEESTGKPLFTPYVIKSFQGEKVGFIGVVTKDTPNIVTAEGVKGLKFLDEADTINKYVTALKHKGVQAIVAVMHEGGEVASPVYNYDCNAGGQGSGVSGAIVDINKRLKPAVDLVISGHTHQSYVCNLQDQYGRKRLVTSAASFGRLFTDLRFKIDKRTHDVLRWSETATNKIVTRDVTPEPEISAMVAKYGELVAPIANAPVGYITADILGRGSTAPESPLGDLIADAQLENTTPADKGGAQLALMNPGGIRSDLQYAQSGSEGNGVVTYGEAFTVQPFTNYLTTISLTGAQLVHVLQQQYSEANEASPKVLQVSEGFTYTVDNAQTGAAKIVVDSIMLNGTAIDQAATYRVTVNSFLAGGGDGFGELANGTDPLVGAIDLDGFVDYMEAHSSQGSPIAPPAADRITFIN